MKTHQDQENTPRIVQQKAEKQESGFKDERSETVVQTKLYDMVNLSPQVTQMQSLQRMADNRVQNSPFDIIQKKENKTGLPDNLKSGIENLSGYGMDDVKVHYNSPKPAQLQAHAYAQGTDIHLASGQEKHLPHEAWHVVQQKQGRVKPTMQMKGKVNVNDDSGLEREADVMGAKAVLMKKNEQQNDLKSKSTRGIIQRYSILDSRGYDNWSAEEDEMFPSQQLNTSITDTMIESVNPIGNTRNLNPKTTVRAKWNQILKNQPSLKVSENSNLAIEHSDDQPKAFYATVAIIEASNKRLKDIGSRIQFIQNTSRNFEVPADMNAPGNGLTTEVSMVTPIKASHIAEGEQLMDTNECNNVANRIVGGAVIVVGKESNNTSEMLEKFDFGNSGTRITTALHNLNNGDDTGDLSNQFALTNNFIMPDAVAANIQVRFQPLIDKNKVHNRNLKWLSLPNMPAYVINQVFNTYNTAAVLGDVNEYTIEEHIQTQAHLQGSENYEQDKVNKQQLIQDLSINEYTTPEVGEAFSTVGSGKEIQILDNNGVMSGVMDLSSLDTIQKGYALMVMKQAGEQLNVLRVQYFNDLRDQAHFQEHHAAVVAKDGSDSITFENYNRSVEKNFLFIKQWEALGEKFKFFADEIAQEIETIATDNTKNALIKYIEIRTKKVRQLQGLNNDLGTLVKNTYIAFQKNSSSEYNDLWHFNMYGTDDGQSFHEKWAASHGNPVTVRTSANVDAEKVQRFRREIAMKLQIKGLDFGSPNVVGTQIPTLYADLLTATTRVESSKLYRNALDLIQSL